jgi:hypothetical protein
MSRHVFVDNSNIYRGASRAAETLEQAVPKSAVRVYYRNLFRLLEGGGDVGTRVLAGSVPPDNDELWRHARDHGYSTDLLKLVANGKKFVEQGVDEALHLKIANALLDHEPPHTLVIASGDGKDAEQGSSFPGQAERALKRGWDVEVWSWKGQLTPKYNSLCLTYPGRVVVRCLDDHYRSITFVKPGDYKVNGATVKALERVVRPVQLPVPQAAA